jgi:hypothetical protein
MSDVKSDDTETMEAPKNRIPEDGPFAVKWMHGTDKLLITKAAKRARKTVGEWLGEAARAYVEAEREDINTAKVIELDSVRRSIALIDPPKPLSVQELDMAFELALKIYSKEGREPPKRGGLIADTKRQLRSRLHGQ